MLYLILAILMFGVIIVVHELGHFTAAKLSGVQVNELSLGMGPLLLHKKRGETEYSLRALPLGGYCAMEGEDGENDNPKAFTAQSGWKKFIILIAGSLMNFLLGVVILLVLYASVTSFATNTISGFADGFPAQGTDGLMAGDEIVRVNGVRTFSYDDVSLELTRVSGSTLDLVIVRDGEKITLNDFTLEKQEYDNGDGTTSLRYGFTFAYTDATFLNRIGYGLDSAFYFTKLVWYSLEMLVTGSAGVNDLAGPVGIVSMVTQVGEQSSSILAGVENVMYFMAMIAINLAVMNLLPLPALDGGRVFFLLVNGVSMLVIRKKIPAKYEGYVHAAGLVLLLVLMALVTLQDVFRIIGS